MNHAEMCDITTAILREMSRVAREIGAVPVLIYLPNGLLSEDESHDDFLLKLCLKEKIDYLSLRSVFNESIKKGILLCDGPFEHWNTEGHKLAAKAISEYLRLEVLE